MRYRIEIKAGAEKSLSEIPHPRRRRIARAIDRLADDPRPAGCVKLTGAGPLARTFAISLRQG